MTHEHHDSPPARSKIARWGRRLRLIAVAVIGSIILTAMFTGAERFLDRKELAETTGQLAEVQAQVEAATAIGYHLDKLIGPELGPPIHPSVEKELDGHRVSRCLLGPSLLLDPDFIASVRNKPIAPSTTTSLGESKAAQIAAPSEGIQGRAVGVNPAGGAWVTTFKARSNTTAEPSNIGLTAAPAGSAAVHFNTPPLTAIALPPARSPDAVKACLDRAGSLPIRAGVDVAQDGRAETNLPSIKFAHWARSWPRPLKPLVAMVDALKQLSTTGPLVRTTIFKIAFWGSLIASAYLVFLLGSLTGNPVITIVLALILTPLLTLALTGAVCFAFHAIIGAGMFLFGWLTQLAGLAAGLGAFGGCCGVAISKTLEVLAQQRIEHTAEELL